MASYYPYYLGPYKSYNKILKATESSWNALSLICYQISPNINRLGVIGHVILKNDILSIFSITSVFEKIEQWFWRHLVRLVNAHRNIYSMTLKGQSTFDPRSRWRGDLIRSNCIWIDASRRDKDNETIPKSLSIFYWQLYAENRWWYRLTSVDPGGGGGGGQRSKIAHG